MRIKLRLTLCLICSICAACLLLLWQYEDKRVTTIGRIVEETKRRFRKRRAKITDTNTVTGYIQHVLDNIDDPMKKLKERKFLMEYMKQRKKIIQLLPAISNTTDETSFHVLVDNTEKRLTSGKYELMILISSHAVNFERRKNIRELWGNTSLSLYKNWKVFFITGGVLKPYYMKKLYDEAVKLKDVVIVDFMENFSLNMGKKVMTALQWATTNFNYDYILKGDDDVFSDVDALISNLRQIHQPDIYLGNVMIGSEVLRIGRYGVSVEEHPADEYEAYCSGGGYVLSKTLVQKLIPLFQWEHPFQVDDAYMGTRVLKAGAKPIDRNTLFPMWNDNCVYFDNVLVTHPANRKCMEKLQRIVLRRRFAKKRRSKKLFKKYIV